MHALVMQIERLERRPRLGTSAAGPQHWGLYKATKSSLREGHAVNCALSGGISRRTLLAPRRQSKKRRLRFGFSVPEMR